MKIACVGDNCIDYYDSTGQAFPGGNAVNVAVYLRRLGWQASYTGVVGDDRYGEYLCRALQEWSVDISHLHVCPGKTALSHVSLVDGERRFGDYEEGVMARFSLTDDDLRFLCQHDLVVTGLWGHTESSLPGIRRCGVPVAFDAAERPFDEAARIALPYANLVFFSDDSQDDAALWKKMRVLKGQGPELIVATRGKHGSTAYDGSSFYFTGPVPCQVVDTMGAGDSYIAGFLTAWLEKHSIPDCMQAGATNAAVTIAYRGAW